MDKVHKSLILVIDDNVTNLKIISNYLTKVGHEVIIAKTGISGVQKAGKVLPDLILLDVRMPQIDGFETCSQLKTQERSKDIPIIFLSAVSDLEPHEKVIGLNLGAVDFISKPIQEDEVVARVNIHLRIRKLTNKLKKQNQRLQAEIAERQVIEEELRRSEEKFAKAFRSSPDPITITTVQEGRLLEVNDSFCRFTGYTPKEVIGKTTIELNLWLNPLKRNEFMQILPKHEAIHNQEIDYRTKQGEVRTMLLSVEIINYDGEDCLLALTRDITERKQAEITLEKANQELKRLANLDGLTKVANRRRFDEYIAQEWLGHQRSQVYLSFILCDVDYFKKYNDYYGHQLGDDCLITVAHALTSVVKRQVDLVSRYGGEEFAIVLPHTNLQGAIYVAQLLRSKVESLQIPHAKSDVSPYVTISLGISCQIPTQDSTLKQFIRGADEALYQAKQQGRNCVV